MRQQIDRCNEYVSLDSERQLDAISIVRNEVPQKWVGAERWKMFTCKKNATDPNSPPTDPNTCYFAENYNLQSITKLII
jgi:hypothetical protein